MPKNRRLLILLLILIIGIPALAYKQADLRNLLNRFSLVPRKEVRINTPKSATPSADLKRPLTCPSVKDFCQKGADVNFNGNYAGFGRDLPKDSPIYALFDGEATVSTTILPQYNNEQIVSVSLESKAKGWVLQYSYMGQAPTKLSFKTGEVISKTGAVMSPYQVSLLVTLVKGNPASGETIHLTPKDFGF